MSLKSTFCLISLLNFFLLDFARSEAWLRTDYPIPVMHVEGTQPKIIRDYGKFVIKDPKGKDTIHAMSSLITGNLLSSGKLKDNKFLQKIASWIYREFVKEPLVKHIPQANKENFLLFGKAIEISEDELWDTVIMPDAGQNLLGTARKTGLQPGFRPLGCTSILWSSNDGSVSMHGRNFDYQGAGTWDRNQLIFHAVPSEPGTLAAVSVGAMGILTPGITGFNESGLTMAVHQPSITENTVNGVCMSVISTEVIRRAHSIDEAIAIIKSYPRAGSWLYVFTQGIEKAVVETTYKEVYVRRTKDLFYFQTSHVFSPRLKKFESFMSPGSYFDSIERYERLQSHGSAVAQSIQPNYFSLIDLISDRVRIAPATISRLDTVQSVVMDAGNKTLWVGLDSAGLPPSDVAYAGYQWEDLRSSAPPKYLGTYTVPSQFSALNIALRSILRKIQIADNVHSSDEISRLLDQYLQTVLAHHIENENLERGTSSGLMAYVWNKLATTEKYDGKIVGNLLTVIDLAMKDPDYRMTTAGSTYRKHLAILFKARLNDLLGHRHVAKILYRKLLDRNPIEPVAKAAEKDLKKSYSWKKTKDININWSQTDLTKL